MKYLLLVAIAVLSNACLATTVVASYSQCPSPDELNHYVLTEFDPFKESSISGQFQIFYRTLKPFDPSKKTLLIIPGGPGDDSRQYDQLFARVVDHLNLVIFDHRGVGCSRPTFHWPSVYIPHAYSMKRAAVDIEAIRKDLLGANQWYVYGVSYGSMLAQAYASQFPDSLEGLILDSAFYSTNGVAVGRSTFEAKFIQESPVVRAEIDQFLKQYPQEKNPLYENVQKLAYLYEGRTQKIPGLIEKLLKNDPGEIERLLHQPKLPRVGMLLQIVCEEVWDYPPSSTGFYWAQFETDCVDYKPFRIPMNFEKDLKNLKVRTLIWGGRYDPATPIESMREMHSLIPDSLFYENIHAAHGIILEKNKCASLLLEMFTNHQSDRAIQNVIASSDCQSVPEGFKGKTLLSFPSMLPL